MKNRPCPVYYAVVKDPPQDEEEKPLYHSRFRLLAVLYHRIARAFRVPTMVMTVEGIDVEQPR